MSKLTALDVIYFYPNIIGYIRIISMLISFYTAHDSWVYFTSFYGLAFIGDVVDGFIARRFNQSNYTFLSHKLRYSYDAKTLICISIDSVFIWRSIGHGD